MLTPVFRLVDIEAFRQVHSKGLARWIDSVVDGCVDSEPGCYPVAIPLSGQDFMWKFFAAKEDQCSKSGDDPDQL